MSPEERLRKTEELLAGGHITEADFAHLKPFAVVDWTVGLENVQKALLQWNGAVAEAWGYSVSHGQLLIRIYRTEPNGGPSPTSLWLHLKDCKRVSFQSSWRDVNIVLEERPGKYGAEIFVTDADRLSVHCGAAFAGESAEWLRL